MDKDTGGTSAPGIPMGYAVEMETEPPGPQSLANARRRRATTARVPSSVVSESRMPKSPVGRRATTSSGRTRRWMSACQIPRIAKIVDGASASRRRHDDHGRLVRVVNCRRVVDRRGGRVGSARPALGCERRARGDGFQPDGKRVGGASSELLVAFRQRTIVRLADGQRCVPL